MSGNQRIRPSVYYVGERYNLCRPAEPKPPRFFASTQGRQGTRSLSSIRTWTLPEKPSIPPARKWGARRRWVGTASVMEHRMFTMPLEFFLPPTRAASSINDHSPARITAPPADARMMAHRLQIPIHPRSTKPSSWCTSVRRGSGGLPENDSARFRTHTWAFPSHLLSCLLRASPLSGIECLAWTFACQRPFHAYARTHGSPDIMEPHV